MGKNFDSRPYCINDFKEWDKRKELVLSPNFQRRSVWSDKAKSFLIDTILRGLPIPKIFMRHFIDRKTGKSVREIVDGQQRIRTILTYLGDGFPIMKSHNEEFGGRYYSQLPEEVQDQILQYEISTDLILNNKDEIVLDIFARLNTYTVSLNKQELLNAKYFGAFKQTSYSLGYEFIKFYLTNNILSYRQVIRMGEAEFTSELVVAMVEGMQDKTRLERFYDTYDDEFKESDSVKKKFKEVMDTIGDIFGEDLQNSYFNSKPLFYSLFCVIYHFKFGMKNIKSQQVKITKENIAKIRNTIDYLEEILDKPEKYKDYKSFIEATRVHTTNLAERRLRFDFIAKSIIRKLS